MVEQASGSKGKARCCKSHIGIPNNDDESQFSNMCLLLGRDWRVLTDSTRLDSSEVRCTFQIFFLAPAAR